VNFLADESVEWEIVERLRQDGHSVQYVAEMSPSISDDEVLDLASQSGLLLLTGDKDFGELVYRQQRLTSGIILARLGSVPPLTRANIVAAVIRKHAEELIGSFTVITPGTTRIRQSPSSEENN
jgi:predicted nuclease of predicted toxin-antitoxin system